MLHWAQLDRNCLILNFYEIYHRSSLSVWSRLGELVEGGNHTPLHILIQRSLFPIVEDGYKKVDVYLPLWCFNSYQGLSLISDMYMSYVYHKN
jgi:hypothetical protein